MLASLFRGNSGQRNSQYIESVTDDAHTRSLLFGHANQVFNLTSSPPPSPFVQPTIRLSSFDDQAGLDLEEKDVRVLLAQDAHGSEEKPILLFDSKRASETTGTVNDGQSILRSPLPHGWRSSQDPNVKMDDSVRSRSSTFSGSQSSWSKVHRDLGHKEDPFLECMFGAPSSAKMSSSTKMHIIPAKNQKWNAADKASKQTAGQGEQRRRTPLVRAYTSGQQSSVPPVELNNQDALLITRLFHVSLDESMKVVNAKDVQAAADKPEKPAKLVERKVPAFAIGLVIQLPYPAQRPHSSQSRLPLNSSYGQSLTSATSSYGSDMQSSWTFLDAIPASLSSSMTVSDEGDRRLDMVVENWDVIVRSMSAFERIASSVVNNELRKSLYLDEPQNKTPKEKFMQRVNQRFVFIRDVASISDSTHLAVASADVARRIAYAVRIPRVITGLGFTAGHWIDEARMLYRTCGAKQQNFFLFNLLTAFLGNHMQWLERLAPEWYRTQFRAIAKTQGELRTLASRTVIVSEHKGVARRLLYILASFLPGRAGIDGLQRKGDAILLPSSTSPNNWASRHHSRRPSEAYLRDEGTLEGAPHEALSTSASSRHSNASTFTNRSPRKNLVRKDSSRFDIGGSGIRTMLDSSAGTSSAIVPQAATTPAAYISILNSRDSNPLDSAVIDTNDSVATADLSRVLTRASMSHRRTSSVSSRWGSLVNGISDIWSNRQSTPGDRSSITTTSQDASPIKQHKRSTSSALSIDRSNSLQSMVDELNRNAVQSIKVANTHVKTESNSVGSRSLRLTSAPPRLHVDEKDGVIDVELDLPGFLSTTSLSPPLREGTKVRSKPRSHAFDGSNSVCSLRSMAAQVSKIDPVEGVNVGGYLRKHHEDFVLHAVRPYHDLYSDIRRALRAEPTPRSMLDQLSQEAKPLSWVAVCTTLVADTKTFSIQRWTLMREYEVKSPGSAGSQAAVNAPNHAKVTLNSEEIREETVMEFDTTLAEAIEKLLDVGQGDQGRSTPNTRSHSRNVSSGSARMPSMTASESRSLKSSQTQLDFQKSERKDLVVGALEDVIRSVNEELKEDTQQANSILAKQQVQHSKQENALREGVKRWMLNVEHTSVW